MTKKIFSTLFFALLLSVTVSAQRVAIVDINDILQNLDEYKLAEEKVNGKAAQWEQEIAQEYGEIKALYNKYQAEEVLLSESQKKTREEQIVSKEQKVRELQKRKFGPEGELFKLRQQLVKPIQDKVFNAIEDYAADRGFDIILDRSSSAGVLFTSSEYNKTKEIKKRLGIK